jgi:hypothetical protein
VEALAEPFFREPEQDAALLFWRPRTDSEEWRNAADPLGWYASDKP